MKIIREEIDPFKQPDTTTIWKIIGRPFVAILLFFTLLVMSSAYLADLYAWLDNPRIQFKLVCWTLFFVLPVCYFVWRVKGKK